MALDDEPDPGWLWPNGVMVNQTEDEFVWVVRQVVNWRTITVPKRDQSMYRRFWCYEGTGPNTAYVAIYAGMIWDGEGDPLAWSKNGQTGVFRAREDAFIDLRSFEAMAPAKLKAYYLLVDEVTGTTPGIILP